MKFKTAIYLGCVLAGMTLGGGCVGANAVSEESVSSPAATALRPNIVYVLVDDLGYGDLGVFHQNARAAKGLPAIATPHLDEMAAAGIQLRGAYCSAPVCAPSRASLLSGRHQGHATVRDNMFDQELKDELTLASMLKVAGYRTAAIGKWGLQGGGEGKKAGTSPDTWPAYPTKRGFDSFYGYVRHRDGHEHYPKEAPHFNGKRIQVWDNNQEVGDGLDKCYTADLFTARAKHFLVEHKRQKSAEPFFLYLAYDTPHATTQLAACPYPAGYGVKGGLQWIGEPGRMINTAQGKIDSWVDPEYANLPPYGNNKGTGLSAEIRYACSVKRIDQAVGDLMQTLKDLGQLENTLVIFTSDNGPSVESYIRASLHPDYFESYGPFDGIKRDCWEGGLRVGALAHWPTSIPSGQVSEHPMQSHDWMSTFAVAAGLPIPARCDGVNLLPLLTGKGTQTPSTLYSEYRVGGKTPAFDTIAPERRGRARGQMQWLREGDFVGVRYQIKEVDAPFEVYDVTKDPGQRHNLAHTRGDLQERFQAQVLRVRRPMSLARRPYDSLPVPALQAAERQADPLPQGHLSWQVYAAPKDGFAWVPRGDGMRARKKGTQQTWALPETARPGEAVRMQGYLNVPTNGTWRVRVSGADATLRLHQALLLESSLLKGDTAEIVLSSGSHPFTLNVVVPANASALKLEWTAPGGDFCSVPDSAVR